MFVLSLQAVEELFNLMQLFVAQRPDMREEELEDVKQFKKTTISCYLRCLDGRSCWTTLIRYTHSLFKFSLNISQDGAISVHTKTLYTLSAFRILLENDEDRLLVVFNRGLILMTEVFTLSSFTLLHILMDSCLQLAISVSAVLQHPAHDVP